MASKKTAATVTILLGLLAATALSNPTQAATMTQEGASESTVSQITCAALHPHNEAACQAMEAKILSSTARLLIYSPLMHIEGFGMRIINSMGHGTVKDGRYLVTHNHYDETVISILEAGDPENLFTVEILNAKGEHLDQVAGQQVSVHFVENETLVFDFGTRDGQALFAALGFTSADFLARSDVDLAPGMEVAQIDWDGSTSHVDWVPVEELTTKHKVPVVRVTNCIKKGASGGGTFWNGAHIGNNWRRLPNCDNGVEPQVDPYTDAALNAEWVVVP